MSLLWVVPAAAELRGIVMKINMWRREMRNEGRKDRFKNHFQSALSILLNKKDILTMQELHLQREINMDSKDALVVFKGTKIRRLWHDEQWFYSVSDIIAVLTDSKDELAYWRKLKQREPQLVTICHGLKLPAADGKLRYADCVNTKNAFRLIQSIPSPKAEPFKQWLAKVGYERIQEIENPEIAQDRVKEYYELKGYPEDWIEKRLRGIAIRQDLTDEWKTRGIQEQKDFAILTNEISKATFGKTVQSHNPVMNNKVISSQ
jgi:DNA-damage-inducible protein D